MGSVMRNTPNMTFEIRDYRPADASAINSVALAAFAEYQSVYSDWPAFSRVIGQMASFAETGEIIVAFSAERTVGAVVYVGPGKPKSPFFNVEWPIIRMLVVEPAFRGLGLGRALTKECIRRARRDGSSVIALHTTPIMKVALPMYQRMGFEFRGEAPTIFGVPYGIYLKHLDAQQSAQPDAQKQRTG